VKRRGARYCRNCETKISDTADRCASCGGVAFYRGANPRQQSLRGLMGRLPDREQPPTDVSYGTPVRRRAPRGARGAGPR